MTCNTTHNPGKSAGIIHVAIPSMNEYEWLPGTIERLAAEKNSNIRIWVCVNQPDHWHELPDKQQICSNNMQTLEYLRKPGGVSVEVIDRCSPGRGWRGKTHGVGQARRTIMESISSVAGKDDIILSLDADTTFDKYYTFSVAELLGSMPGAAALSNPYYHKLTGNTALDRAMLRYEIYMRYYALNLWRIGSPYSFTALGSAIALPLWSYRKIGGITAKKSGEDFYLLQKLRKSGWICNYNTHLVYPGTRYSDRVFFGTGPALIKGSRGDWSSYPVYNHELFDRIRESYDLFPQIFERNTETPLTEFLKKVCGEKDPFEPLRLNSTSPVQFTRACHQKVDGLRILQFIKSENKKLSSTDEEHLAGFLNSFYPYENLESLKVHEKCGFINEDYQRLKSLDFKTTENAYLDKIRNLLFILEAEYQKNDLKWKSRREIY